MRGPVRPPGDPLMNSYPDPTPFRSLTRTHLRQWVARELGVQPSDRVSVTLPRTYAAGGGNFWSRDVVAAVKARFPNAFNTKRGRGSRAGDALCSAHAPFNLLAPLGSHLDSGAAARVLCVIVGIDLGLGRDDVDSSASTVVLRTTIVTDVMVEGPPESAPSGRWRPILQFR
jgi:hypothetical protein